MLRQKRQGKGRAVGTPFAGLGQIVNRGCLDIYVSHCPAP